MIIVSGQLTVDPASQGRYLDECRQVMVLARQAPGCIDFHLSADPLEPGRINIYEQWDSVEAVESFRGSGPPSDQTTAIRGAAVFQHEIASSQGL